MSAPNMEAPGEVGTGRALNTDVNERLNCAAERAAEQAHSMSYPCDAERKAQATLTAMLALRGYSVHELACSGFFVSRWDRSMHCSDLAQVRAFYRRIGGAV